MSAIVLEGVGKRYADAPPDAWALRNVTLGVDDGELVALMGPSGSGKSTLLNLVAGLDVPTAGTVRLRGHVLADLSDDTRSDLRLREVGFVFQAFNLFANLSAVENVAWPHRFVGGSWRDALARATALLQEVGLDAATHQRRPADLSGGEQQRVALARALVNEPHVLLADEPTGNLDARTAATVIELLSRTAAARGVAVLLVTHNPAIAAHAARILTLEDGRLVGESRRAASPLRRVEGSA